MSSIPAPPTLSITTRDKMNYGGQLHGISSVAAGVDDNNGKVSYAVVLDNGIALTLSADDTILSAEEGSSTGVNTWVQSVKA